ncbi:MAG: hypothetical protein ACM3JB_14715 [Acidobacteriaceae bacterium]
MPVSGHSSILAASPSEPSDSSQKRLGGPPLITQLLSLWEQFASKLDQIVPFSLSLKVVALVAVLSWYTLLPVPLTTVTDSDLGWHLRSGEWILQHHSLPRTDPFSATGAGTPWVAYSWTFSVLIYEIAKNFDLLGIAAYTLFAWMAITFAFFRLVRSRGATFWPAIGLTAVAGSILRRVVAPRPGTITILLFVVLLQILLQERENGYTRRIWIAPFIIWIWANVHVQFVYGLFLIGLFCVEPILDRMFLRRELERRPSARLWAVLIVSGAATLLNPYGFGPYQVLIDFAHQPLLIRYVQETSAMSFTANLHYFVLFLTLGMAFVLGWRRQVQPLWVILLVWSAVSSFRFERDIWLVTAVAAAAIATRPADAAPVRRESSRLWLYGTLGLLVVSFVTLKRVPSNHDLLAMVSRRMPVGAVAYIHEHHLSGPLFNDYDWGGFLTYALPEIPVAIDGRTNVHGQNEVGQNVRTWGLGPGWDKDPLLNRANLVIGLPGAPLTNYLRKDLHFKVVFDDGFCVLFQRVAPA